MRGKRKALQIRFSSLSSKSGHSLAQLITFSSFRLIKSPDQLTFEQQSALLNALGPSKVFPLNRQLLPPRSSVSVALTPRFYWLVSGPYRSIALCALDRRFDRAMQGNDSLFALSWATEAAHAIDRQANFDRNIPDLGKLICGGGASPVALTSPNSSSHNYSYRPYTDEEILATTGANGVALWKQQLAPTGFHRALPRRVRELAGNEEFASLRGLWAEVHRAWVTCDDRLLIWNYEASSSSSDLSAGSLVVGDGGHAGGNGGAEDYVEVGELGHVITSVGLVVPRPDFFAPAIKVRHGCYLSSMFETTVNAYWQFVWFVRSSLLSHLSSCSLF